MATSLYVHIPFCQKRCIYCDFVSGIYEPERAKEYVNALKKEITTYQNKDPLETLYIGGGTPTSLDTETLCSLLTITFKHFDINSNYEATVEANPGTLNREKLESLLSSGINRISIGVQSFNNDLLEFLGRIHSSKEAVQAVNMAIEAGFRNISIDLIYGIPGQTLDIWQETLDKAVSLEPAHISTYELTYEKGTVLYNMFEDNRIINLPEEDRIVEMYEYAIDFLKSKGFPHYEISNFALPGFECRHNLNYWERGNYYGAGLGAHSFIDSRRHFNIKELDRYIRLLQDNLSPVDAIEKITKDMALSEALFLGLRKTSGISFDMLSKAFGKNMLSVYEEAIQDMKKEGLIEITGSDSLNEKILRLTDRGLLLSNEVFVKFL